MNEKCILEMIIYKFIKVILKLSKVTYYTYYYVIFCLKFYITFILNIFF